MFRIPLHTLKGKIVGSRLATDSFWALLGSILGKGLTLLAGVLVARFLGKDAFGEYGVIKNTLITIGMFSTFGLGYTATKYIAEYRQGQSEKIPALSKFLLQITFICSLVIGILVFSFSKQIAVFIKAPDLDYGIRLCSIIVVFNALTLTQISILAGLGEYKTIARNNTYSGILTFSLSFILTYKYNFNGSLWALLISQFYNFLINAHSIRKFFQIANTQKISLINRSKLAKGIISFSFPVALQESLVFISSWLSTYILIVLTNYGEVGLYSAANQWNAIILFIPGVLRNVTLSHLAGSSQNEDSHKRVLKVMLCVNFLSTFCLYIIVLLTCNLAGLLYGKSYEGIGTIMAISTASTIFNSMSDVYVQEYMSMNMNWFILVFRIIKDTLAIALTTFLIITIHSTGARAVAVSSVALSIVYLGVLMFGHRMLKKNYLKAKIQQ